MKAQFERARDTIRRAERQVFESAGRIFTRTRGAFNEETGAHAPGTETDRYNGPLRIVPQKGVVRSVGTAGEQHLLRTYVVKAPETVAGVAVNDRVLVTASPDPHLVGKELRVESEPGDEWIIHRRLTCIEEGRDG